MPSMASITVKKNDGTTDIIYDQLTAASSNGSDAEWRQDTGATAAMPVGHRAVMRCRSFWNGNRSARKLVIVYERPYSVLNTTTGRYETRHKQMLRVEVTNPVEIPSSELNEGIAQAINLLDSPLIVASCQTGFAPT